MASKGTRSWPRSFSPFPAPTPLPTRVGPCGSDLPTLPAASGWANSPPFRDTSESRALPRRLLPHHGPDRRPRAEPGALLPPPAPRAVVSWKPSWFRDSRPLAPTTPGTSGQGAVLPCLPRGHWAAWARPQHGGPSPPPRFSSPIPGEGLPRGVRLHLRLPSSRAEPQG